MMYFSWVADDIFKGIPLAGMICHFCPNQKGQKHYLHKEKLEQN